MTARHPPGPFVILALALSGTLWCAGAALYGAVFAAVTFLLTGGAQ